MADHSTDTDHLTVTPFSVTPFSGAGEALRRVDHVPGVPKPDPILVVDGISRSFGGIRAVNVEHLEIQRGAITALIGPNGAGKTTFFNLLTGFDRPDSGTREFNGAPLDHRKVIGHRNDAAGRAAALGGLAMGSVIVAWLLLRITHSSGVAAVVIAAGLAAAGAVVVWLKAVRQRVFTPLAVWGAALVGALVLGLFYRAVVTLTSNWTTVLLVFLALVATGAVLGWWSYNASPPAPYELARLGMVRTFQLTKSLSRLTVIENMLLGTTDQSGEKLLGALLRGRWKAEEARSEARADELLARFNMAHMRDDMAGTLSGGQRKLLEMARALMTNPVVVMLDEPMAGVNPALTQNLLGHIKNLREDGMTVVFVEHDMDVVREISDWVVVMAEGEIIAEGPPSVIGANQAVIDAYLGRDDEATNNE